MGRRLLIGGCSAARDGGCVEMPLHDWEVQQEKVFVGWVNSVLTRHEDGKGGSVESLGTAFADGVQLIRLVESLADESIGKKYSKKAKNKAQMIDNLNLALTFAEDVGLTDQTATVGAEDFVDNVHTQISGFVWTLFKSSQGDRGSGADSELLEWCASTASKVNPGVVVHDFKSSFQDGTVLASIVAASDPPAYSELLSAMSNSTTDKVQLVGMATAAAATGDLHVPQLIEPELIASASADEKSMQMYIALIRMAWDQLAGERPEAARVAELEAIIVTLRSQLDSAQTARTGLKFQLAAAQAQLGEATAAKQAEMDRANQLQEDLDVAKQQLEDGEQRLTNEQSRHAAESAALQDEIKRLGAVIKDLNAGQESLKAELEESKAARIAAAKASSNEHAAELSAALEKEKAAAERAAAQEAAAAAAAADAAAARQQSRETVRQAKAAHADARIKVESAFKGRKALSEEVNAARRAMKALEEEKADLEAGQSTLAEYSKTAFWSGNAALPYGCQKCGWVSPHQRTLQRILFCNAALTQLWTLHFCLHPCSCSVCGGSKCTAVQERF